MGLGDCSVEAAMAVSDLARARRFYEGQLGLIPAEEDEQGVRYRCAEGTGIFIYLSPENAGTSRATLAGWLVDDLDRTMDELTSQGVAFERYDQPGIRTACGGSTKPLCALTADSQEPLPRCGA